MTTATKPCDLFPMLGAAEFEALKRDIAEHGQREAILCVDGEIVDGRNRMRACEELGIEPIVRNLSADEAGDVWALAMSENWHRRHLDPHEKGHILKEYMARVGAKRGAGRPKKSDTVSEIPKTLPQVAKALGIEERAAQRAVKASDDYEAASPENKAKVDAGELTPKQARVATEKAVAKQEPSEAGGREPQRTKPKRRIEQVRADCEHAIDAAIDAAVGAYPELKAEIAAHLRLLIKELSQ